MILTRVGAHTYELDIEPAGGILYRVKYDGREAHFDCEGDEVDIINAAADVVARKEGK